MRYLVVASLLCVVGCRAVPSVALPIEAQEAELQQVDELPTDDWQEVEHLPTAKERISDGFLTALTIPWIVVAIPYCVVAHCFTGELL